MLRTHTIPKLPKNYDQLQDLFCDLLHEVMTVKGKEAQSNHLNHAQPKPCSSLPTQNK